MGSEAAEIRFHLPGEPHGEFSNFARYRIWLRGKSWPTAEHYFQAMKFETGSDQEEIRMARTPKEAAEKGRDRKRRLRPDWDAVREDYMREALEAKFGQHAELRALLEATGDAELIEHTRTDAYWGDGGDGHGKNRLGILLMELRKRLRA